MPIPTKVQLAQPETDTGTLNRAIPSTRTRSDRDRNLPQKAVHRREPSSEITNQLSDSTQKHTVPVPRPSAKDASSPVKPTTNRMNASSRTSSTSSAASHPAPSVQPRNLSSNPRLNVRPSGHGRMGSTSTTTASRLQTPQVTRSKLPSSVQPGLKSLRGQKKLKDGGTTGASATNLTISKADSQPPMSRLRDELYQLQLIHMSSRQNLVQYERSIEQKVTTKKAQLGQLQDQILELESAHQQALSVEALSEWLRTRNQRMPGTAIQQLSSAIVELEKVCQESVLQMSLSVFEQWLSDARSIREERKSLITASTGLRFVRSLDHMWHERMRELQQILETVIETLRELEIPADDSGVGSVAARHSQLAVTLVHEVKTAMTIEEAIMQAESAWETEQLQVAMEELAGKNTADSAEVYKGIWTQ